MAEHVLSAMLYWSADATASSAQADHFTVYGIFKSASYKCMFLFEYFVYMHLNYSSLDWDHKGQKMKLPFRQIFLTVDQLHLFFFFL